RHDQPSARERVSGCTHEVERIGLRRAVGEKIDATATHCAWRLAKLGDERSSPFELRRVSDWTTGKREVTGKITEHSLRRCEIGAAENSVDAERHTRLERSDDRFLCCTYNLEIARPIAAADHRDELVHRLRRHADVLEADVRDAELADLIDEARGVLDRAVVARQHEDEIHRVPVDRGFAPPNIDVGNL